MRRFKRILLVALLFLVTGMVAEGQSVQTLTFSKSEVGKLPDGWSIAATGAGSGGVWKVTGDDTAPSGKGVVLTQLKEDEKAQFNLCVFEDSRFLDGSLKVSLKANQGQKDQGGGLVWRYQNADHYYLARLNPLESNLRIYKVIGGKRMQLATTEDSIKIAAGSWHTLAIRHSGKRIECLLDGKKLLETEDGTISKSGKVGLWTKADAQTSFDRFQFPVD